MVRGNCDAEVDQMVLDFPCMADYAQNGDDQGRTPFLPMDIYMELVCMEAV